MKTIVADTSPIIALARIGKLELLRALFGVVLIPDAVYHELTVAGRPGADEVQRSDFLRRVSIQQPPALGRMSAALSRADNEALCLAKQENAAAILGDDSVLIREATNLSLPIITTRNLLLQAKKQGLLASVKQAMDDMRRSGVGIPDVLYFDTLQKAGETQ
jgi:hypothetical protein